MINPISERAETMRDIKGFDTFVKIEPVSGGWSRDKKYRVETDAGERLLLRVADVAAHDRKYAEYEMLTRVAELDVPAPRPMAFGTCDGGSSVYLLLTWMDGADALNVLPTLTEAEQYNLGLKAGGILRKIHTISAPEGAADWAPRFHAVFDRRLADYRKCPVRVDGGTYMLDYLEAHRPLLEGRPQSRHHGDYHSGNLLIAENGTLSVIDWEINDFDNYGDPWYEFNRIINSLPISAPFYSGQLSGYFGGEPPRVFWELYAYYTAANTLGAIPFVAPLGGEYLEEYLLMNKTALEWFDNMRNPVPAWYQKEL
jgi:serine/threonine-protein kinase